MVSKAKKELVAELAQLTKDNPIVGVVNMQSLPAPQMQKMRATLRGDVQIRMAKKKLMTRALEQSGVKGVTDLTQYFNGMPALLFTKENPFKLYKSLEKNKSPAPAKAGQVAPKDVIVKAGPTNFAPGPIIGELGSVGIKTGVEGGKLAIKEDATVAKEGDVISAKLAGLLKRLGVEPMEVGLDMVAVFEEGVVYKSDVLAIDDEKFSQDLSNAAMWAMNLALEAGIHNKDSIEVMLVKGARESRSLALEARFLADEVAQDIVTMAEREALSLKAEANVETGASKPAPEKKAEAPKEEEKKEEPKVEEAAPTPEPAAQETPKETQAPKEETPAEPESKPEEPAAETEQEESTNQDQSKEEENKEEAAGAHIEPGEFTEQVREMEKEAPVEIKEEDALPPVIETGDVKEPAPRPQEAPPTEEKLSGLKAAVKKIEDLFSITKEDAQKLEVTKNEPELTQKALEDLKNIDAQLHEAEPQVEELKAHVARLRALIEAKRTEPDAQQVEQLVEKLQKEGTLRPEEPKRTEQVPTAHELLERKKKKEDQKGDA